MVATLGGATYGGAALGAGPSPVASGLAIRLAGAALPATWTADELRIAESVEQRAVCDLTIRTRAGPAAVAPGTRLDVAYGGVVLFTGTVERTVDAILPGSARAVEIKLTAVDASQIADRRLITDRIDFTLDDAHPTGWRADQIARTLVHSYLAGEGVTAFSTDCGSLVTAAFAFQTVAAALDQLSEATGSVWKIGPTRDLTFGPRTLNMAPLALVQAYATEVRSTPGLVGYWRLGEASGAATAVDLGPNALHGTYTGSPTLGVAGLISGDTDTAVTFTGSDRVTVGDVLDFPGLAPFTIEAWTRPTSLDGAQRRVAIKQAGAPANGYNLGVSSGNIFFWRRIDDVDVIASFSSSGMLNARTHVVGVYDGATVQLYRDAVAGTAQSDTRSANDNAGDLRLGGGGSTIDWVGDLDEVAIYDRALTADEIRAHYQAGRDVWTHRPTLEHATVERTRERLRTVQVVRAPGATEILRDRCQSTSGYTVGGSAHVRNGEEFILATANDYLARDLGLTDAMTIAASINLVHGSELQVWFHCDSTGLGQMFQVGVSSQRAGFAVTTTFGVPPPPPFDTDAPSSLVQGAPAHLLLTVTGTTATAQTFGGGVPIGSYGPFAYTRRGTWFAIHGTGSASIPFGARIQDLAITAEAGVLVTRAASSAISSTLAIEGGTGRYEAVLVNESAVRAADVITQADALLRRFGQPATILTFETDTLGLRAGQLLPVHLSAFGLSDDMLIESVDLRLDGGVGRLITRVQAVSDEQQGSTADFWRTVTGAA